MKVNNIYFYNLIIYSQTAESLHEFNPYETAAVFDSVNIYGEPYRTSGDSFEILTAEPIKEVQERHTTANKKKKIIFSVNKVLYIPIEKITSHTTTENRQELEKGLTAVSYNDYFTFDNSIKIKVYDSKIFFAKPTDQVNPKYREDCQDIAEEIAQTEKYLIKYADDAKQAAALKKYKNLLEEKLKQGFKYKVFQFRSVEKETNLLLFKNRVDHYEKTAEYIKIEKLTKELNKIIRGVNIQTTDTAELLKVFKIIKRRKNNEI